MSDEPNALEELMCRAISKAHAADPDEQLPPRRDALPMADDTVSIAYAPGGPQWSVWINDVRSVIKDLEAAGLRVVPETGTEEICQAMHDGPLGADDEHMDRKTRDWLMDMWWTGVKAFDYTTWKPEEEPGE